MSVHLQQHLLTAFWTFERPSQRNITPRPQCCWNLREQNECPRKLLRVSAFSVDESIIMTIEDLSTGSSWGMPRTAGTQSEQFWQYRKVWGWPIRLRISRIHACLLEYRRYNVSWLHPRRYNAAISSNRKADTGTAPGPWHLTLAALSAEDRMSTGCLHQFSDISRRDVSEESELAADEHCGELWSRRMSSGVVNAADRRRNNEGQLHRYQRWPRGEWHSSHMNLNRVLVTRELLCIPDTNTILIKL